MNVALELVPEAGGDLKYQTHTDDQTIERLKHYIEHSPQNSRRFRITPAVALWIKENCTPGGGLITQRRKSPSAIAKYAKAMKSSRWYLTGASLAFTVGRLLGDGQQRLDACIIAATAFDTHIVFGVPDRFFAWMDIGKPRTPANILQIAKFDYDNECAAATRWIKMFETHRVPLRDQYEGSDILVWAKANRDKLVDNPNSVVKVAKAIADEPAGTLAALLWVFRDANKDKSAEFEAALAGEPTADDLALGIVKGVRRKLSEMSEAAQGRIKEVPRLAHYVTAWNFFLAGGLSGKRFKSYRWRSHRDPATLEGRIDFPLVAKTVKEAKAEIAKIADIPTL